MSSASPPPERTRRARTERGGWQGRAEESLGAAWELRQSVVGHVADPSDLCSLALALPCALCAPCLLRLQLFCRPSTAPDSAARSATVALALFLAGQATSEALGELVRRCPGLSHALLCPGSCGLRDAVVAVCSSPCADPCSLRLLAALPGLPPQTLALASAEGLKAACRAGGPRAALLLQELSHAVYVIAQSGLSAGCVEVLDALAEPPYSLTHDDAKLCSVVLMKACHDGRAEIVRRLGQPPYCLGTTEACMNSSSVLGVACQHGHASVVAELAAPPYSMGRAEAREADALMLACKDGCLEVVNALAHGPFYLGHWDAARRGNICLFFACIGGHEGVVRALAEPPYSIACDPDKPQSMLDALAAVGPVATAENNLGDYAGLFLSKETNSRFLGAFSRSGGPWACAVLLSSCLIKDHLSDLFRFLRRVFDVAKCPDVPDCVLILIFSCVQRPDLDYWARARFNA
eukprot:m51a1_g13799 hypothetical protein (465) ;mRNA; r:356589-360314